MGPLDRFGASERTGELDVGSGEVEWLGLGPQPSAHRERRGEALHGVREVVEWRTVCLVLASRHEEAGTGAGADADAEVEPPSGDDVHSRGDRREHRGRAKPVARHEQSDPDYDARRMVQLVISGLRP
jgi:hypothetical protein